MKVCRVCALEIAEDDFQMIFEGIEPIAEMMYDLCGFKVTDGDGLPKAACNACYMALKSAIELKQKCLESDAKFRELIKNEEFPLENCQKTSLESPMIRYKIIYEEVLGPVPQEVERSHIINDVQVDTKEEFVEVLSAKDTKAYEELENPFRCCGCESMFETNDLLLEHARTVHEPKKSLNEERPFQCEICYKRYTSQRGIKTHRKSAYQLKHHQCAVCGRRFQTRTVLENHERTHTKQKPFECSYCSKAFGTRTNLLCHVKLHSEAPMHTKHMCSVCGKGFSKKNYLKCHYSLVHSEVTPFDCKFCPRKFKLKANLRLHLRTHTQERPYSCELCDRSFMYPTDKKRHMIQHTGQKPFKCPDCDKAFTRKGLLRKHRLRHTGDTLEGGCD